MATTGETSGGPTSGGHTAASGTPTVDVVMPQMGVSVSEGTVVEWRKHPGDWVAYEEPICDITTDKIDTEIPSPAAGRLAEIVVDVGATVEVGAVLARIATDARPGEPHASEQANGAATVATDAPPAAATATEAAPTPAKQRGSRRYSPVVTRIAAEHGIDLEHVQGSGRDGRVRKQDVLALVDDAAAEPPMHIESPYRPEPSPAPVTRDGPYAAPAAASLSRMRRTIGEHMKRSLETAATCTTWIEVDMSGVERARAAARLTALPFVARAAIDALREFPALNAWLEGDRHTVHEDVNLGIAVSLGDEGLIVPVIRSAQDLSAEGLAKRIRELARAARGRTLTPDDVAGGTFTITNPGQYGSVMATPVINLPQVAILDLEAVVKRAVVITDADGADAIAIRPICVFGMSWDHRALDGVLAAQFLAAIKRRLEAL